MDHLEELTGALIDTAVEAVTAGLDEAASDHQAMRAKGEGLRDHAAMLALLGPRLYKLAHTILGEIQRRSVPRFAAALGHVRYSTDAPVNELEDARRTLNQALLKTQSAPGAMSMLLLAVAIVRVRAITQALGAACVAVPPRADRNELRRREIDAADIDPEVADLLMAMTEGDWDAALARLHALEIAPANRIGIVSSLIALAEDADGHVHLNKIATRLLRARYNRPTPAPAKDEAPSSPRRIVPALPDNCSRELNAPSDLDPRGPARDQRETVDPPSITARFRANPAGKTSAAERLRKSQEAHARDRR